MTREQTLKAQMARRMGLEALEGQGPWRDPHTGHVVALVENAWQCELCGRDFGQTIGRLGPRQRRCPGEAREENVRRVRQGGRGSRGGGAGQPPAPGPRGQPSVLALLGAGVKRGRNPEDLEVGPSGPGPPGPDPEEAGGEGGTPAASRRRRSSC